MKLKEKLVLGLFCFSSILKLFGQGTPISSLPAASVVNSNDFTIIVQGGVTKKATIGLINTGATNNVSASIVTNIAFVQAQNATNGLLPTITNIVTSITPVNAVTNKQPSILAGTNGITWLTLNGLTNLLFLDSSGNLYVSSSLLVTNKLTISGGQLFSGGLTNTGAEIVQGSFTPAEVGASKIVRTGSGSNLLAVTIGGNLSFDGTTLSVVGTNVLGGTITNVIASNNIVTLLSGTNLYIQVTNTPIFNGVTTLTNQVTNYFIVHATNNGSSVFGGIYDIAFPFNVNESANFNLPAAIYNAYGPIATFDASGFHRRGFVSFNGQFPQDALAKGASWNLVTYDATDLLNVNSTSHSTNQLTVDSSGNFTVAHNQTVSGNGTVSGNLTVVSNLTAGTFKSPSVPTNMSPAAGNNALSDMFTATNFAAGQLGYASFSDRSFALYGSGASGNVGTNAWGYPMDVYGGIRANGNPYWYDIPKSPYAIQGVYQGFGPTKSSFATTWPSGFGGTANQVWFEVVNAAAYGGIAGIISRVGHTNSASGSLVGTNADGTPIYINQFGFMMAEFSDAYMPHGTELGRISQQGPSYTLLGNDSTRNIYLSFNGGRPGDTSVGQLVTFVATSTNLNTAFRSGNASWSGFPLQLPDTYIPTQTTFKWTLAADENSGDVQMTNGTASVSNVVVLGNISYQTNAQTTLINFKNVYSDLVTNANFAFVGFTGLSNTMVQATSILLTNTTSPSIITFTTPANCHFSGTLNCTNVTKIDFICNGRRWTNAISTPLF